MKNDDNSLTIRGASGEELIAFHPAPARPEKKLKPISKNAASILANAGVTSGLTAISGQGLFRATVNPAMLMTYADGTVSSIVTEGGRFAQHAGFQSVSSAAVCAPLLAFQVASMVTGQYYFNLLSKQMNQISRSINDIKDYLEDRDRVTITETYNRLEEISIQMRCGTTDDDVLFRIHQYIDKVSEISSLYRILWERKFSEYEQNVKKKTSQNFAEAEFNNCWNVFSGSLLVLGYAHALEFVIRLEKKVDLYPSLKNEYSQRFEGYLIEFQEMGKTFYLPQSCQEPIKRTASCIEDIYLGYSRSGKNVWLSEKEKREIAQNQRNAEKLLCDFAKENLNLSEFNLKFKENTGKAFRGIEQDHYLFFDASTGQYFLEEA